MAEATTWVFMVHPDDVNLADVKAKAAECGATIIGNRFVQRGTVLRTTQAVIDLADKWGSK